MNSKTESHIRAAFLGLSLSVIGVMAVVIGMHPITGVVEGQRNKSACQFQIYLRPPIEFAGPAGGGAADFRLYQPTRHGADVQLSNIWSTQEACSWSASVNQNWVTLSQSSGTIQAEAEAIVTVSVNERVTELGRGAHTAWITFTSRQDPNPNQSKKVRVIVHAQTPCDLQVIGGTYRARAVQGEVPQQPSVAKLTNSGDAPCRWKAHSGQTWLTVTPVGGELGPREEQRLTIRANSGAASLLPNDHNAVVLLEWRETHDEYKEIQAILEVDAPPCELHFASGQKFEARGKAGSTEFAPEQQKYVLENRGGTPCYYWQANGLPDWLEVNDEDTIYGKSQTDVVVRVKQSAAAQLRPDVYAQTVRFGAGNVSAEHGLEAFIDVDPLPCHLEVVEEDLYFRIQPEGLIQSETEQLLTLRNDWKNEQCHWKSESRVDWLTAVPDTGTLAGGDSMTVLAKIVQSDDFAKLDAGEHTENLGFSVAGGSAGQPLPVTIKIDCDTTAPCAYLHTSHTKTEVLKPAEISLTLYNPTLPKPCDLPRSSDGDGASPTPTPCIDYGNITAQLIAEVPSGWEVGIGNLAERCSGICNRTYSIIGGQQEFIELIAVPNNAGIFDFAATVYWGEATEPAANGESTDERKSSKLRVEVEVTDPSAAIPPQVQQSQITTSDAVQAAQAVQQIPTQIAPTIASQLRSSAVAAMVPTTAPAATPEPEAPAPISPQNAPPGGGVTSVDDRRAADSGISMNLLGLGIAVVVIVLIAAVVGGILLGRRRRAPAPIDYDELARAMNRQQENPSPE